MNDSSSALTNSPSCEGPKVRSTSGHLGGEPSRSSRRVRILRLIGSLLGGIGLAVVTVRVFSMVETADLRSVRGSAWLMLAALCIAHALANGMLVRAWWHILTSLKAEPTWEAAIRIYGVSLLAKYLPGNVGQIISRQALGMAVGIPASPLAVSAVWELGLIAAAGFALSSLAAPLLVPGIATYISAAALTILLSAILATAHLVFGPGVARAIMWHVVFLTTSGAVFVVVLGIFATFTAPGTSLTIFIGAYVAAWWLGFVTPGVPAGVGIREGALLAMLSGRIPESELLIAVVGTRLVTIVGDVLFAGCARSWQSGHSVRKV